ncbi:MAG: hypothetical protein ACJAYX_004741 [Planctomycetota bacterium]|jgi:hypothetical protein
MGGRRLREAIGHISTALLDMVFWDARSSWWVGQEHDARQHAPGWGIHLCTSAAQGRATDVRD